MSPASSAASVAGSRRRSEVATQVRSPAVGGDSRSAAPTSCRACSSASPRPSVASATAHSARCCSAVQHRPAPLPGPDQLDPVGVVQGVRVDRGEQPRHRQVRPRPRPRPPPRTATSRRPARGRGCRPAAPTSPWSYQQPSQHPGHNPYPGNPLSTRDPMGRRMPRGARRRSRRAPRRVVLGSATGRGRRTRSSSRCGLGGPGCRSTARARSGRDRRRWRRGRRCRGRRRRRGHHGVRCCG